MWFESSHQQTLFAIICFKVYRKDDNNEKEAWNGSSLEKQVHILLNPLLGGKLMKQIFVPMRLYICLQSPFSDKKKKGEINCQKSSMIWECLFSSKNHLNAKLGFFILIFSFDDPHSAKLLLTYLGTKSLFKFSVWSHKAGIEALSDLVCIFK